MPLPNVVNDYGAAGNGTTNDLPKILEMLNGIPPTVPGVGYVYFAKAGTSGRFLISDNLLLAPGQQLEFGYETKIIIADGKKVVAYDPISAPRQQIFEPADDESASMKIEIYAEILAEWIGVTTSNDADVNRKNWDRFLKGIDPDKVSDFAVKFGMGTYEFNAPFYVVQQMCIEGVSHRLTTIELYGTDVHGVEFAYLSGGVITTYNELAGSTTYVTLRDIFFDCGGITEATTRYMCYAVGSSSMLIEGCRFTGPIGPTGANPDGQQMRGMFIGPNNTNNPAYHRGAYRSVVRWNRIIHALDGIQIGRADGSNDLQGGDAAEHDIYENYLDAGQSNTGGRRGIYIPYWDNTGVTSVNKFPDRPYSLNIRGNTLEFKTSSSAITTLSGTLTFTNGSTAVTGNGTSFQSQISTARFDTIYVAGQATPKKYPVASIADNTHLTLVESFEGTTGAYAQCNIRTGFSVLSGKLKFSAANPSVVTGTNTFFLSEVNTNVSSPILNDSIYVPGISPGVPGVQRTFRVASVASDSSLTLASVFTGTHNEDYDCEIRRGCAFDIGSAGEDISIEGNYIDDAGLGLTLAQYAKGGFVRNNFYGGNGGPAFDDKSTTKTWTYFGTGGNILKLQNLTFAYSNPDNVLKLKDDSVFVTSSYHQIDTETGSTDNLVNINGGRLGQFLIIRANDSSRTIIVKDGTGNLRLSADFPMDNAQDTLTLFNDPDTGNWYELCRSSNQT